MWKGGAGGKEKVKISEVEIVYLWENVCLYTGLWEQVEYLWDVRSLHGASA